MEKDHKLSWKAEVGGLGKVRGMGEEAVGVRTIVGMGSIMGMVAAAAADNARLLWTRQGPTCTALRRRFFPRRAVPNLLCCGQPGHR